MPGDQFSRAKNQHIGDAQFSDKKANPSPTNQADASKTAPSSSEWRDDIHLLRLPQVLALIPVGRSTWWAGVKSGRYPAPVKLGPRITVWRASDIAKYITAAGKGAS